MVGFKHRTFYTSNDISNGATHTFINYTGGLPYLQIQYLWCQLPAVGRSPKKFGKLKK